ncbi:tetratricopeptide repeat protein [Campylobacter geochelonis]|uniref:tetratricopeptide repeat protein n=1 Tax=Campylobacter geochelonis TaxID=1780362 RepID=UPI0007707486|nr:SEL1-like repeat protein [Campylobacter geochelonis]CZE48227.1 Hsp12 variant C [Campylobacter geochelonis]CZE50028.1 Hsp12 variant C [Campylobacter geochelonis]
MKKIIVFILLVVGGTVIYNQFLKEPEYIKIRAIDGISTVKNSKFLEKSCNKNVAKDCYYLGEYIMTFEKNPDKNKAKSLFEKACNLNEAFGCTLLSMHFYDARPYSYDKETYNYKKARELYQQACDLNDGYGCALLALLIFDSEKNEETYFNLSKKACDLEDRQGCLNLATIYQTGDLGAIKKDSALYERYSKLAIDYAFKSKSLSHNYHKK